MILTAAIYFPSKGGEKQRKIDCIVYEGKKILVEALVWTDTDRAASGTSYPEGLFPSTALAQTLP